MSFVVTQGCVDILDKSCIAVCPVDCIYEGDRMMYIHPTECVDCGACEPVCPQGAIFWDEEVPADMAVYAEGAQAFFTELGDPGGAEGQGRAGYDSPRLISLLADIPRVNKDT